MGILVCIILVVLAVGVYVYITNRPTSVVAELKDAENLVETEVVSPVKAEATKLVDSVKKVV